MGDEVNTASGMVEISFSGKKLMVKADFLDQWRDMSFEQKEVWFENHKHNITEENPEYHPTFEGAASGVDTDDDIDVDIKKFQKPKKKKEDQELSDYVVVHFNGKSLLLPRKEITAWYEQMGPEDKLEYLRNHPDIEIQI